MILSALFGSSTINLIVLSIVVFFSSFGFPGGSLWLVASGAGVNTSAELTLVMIVGASAAILGDFSAYILARKFSFKLQKFLKRFKFYSKHEVEIQSKFNQSEFVILFFSRFIIQGLCVAATYVSGFLRLKIRKFLVPVISGEILYGIEFPLLGFFFKETWNDYATLFSDVTVLVLLVIIAYFIIRWTVRYYIRRKNYYKNA